MSQDTAGAGGSPAAGRHASADNPPTPEQTSPPLSAKHRSTDGVDTQARTPGWIGVIERIGNRVPHPALIFLGLCVFVILLSWVLSWFHLSVTHEVADLPAGSDGTINYPDGVTDHVSGGLDPGATPGVHTETTTVRSLISVPGVRFLFTSFVSNFANFGVVAVILVAMLGVGVAEEAGLMGALIRKLVAVAPRWAITFIIVFVGMISSIAADAGYVILIPLAGLAFRSVGRHPVIGLGAAYAGVSAGFAVNILITPGDGILTEVTNEAIGLTGRNDLRLGITNNLWWNIVSTIVITFVIVWVTRLVERRYGPYDPSEETVSAQDETTAGEIEPARESRGLRFAGLGALVVIIIVLALALPPGAPLRNADTGSLIEDSPLLDSLIVTITLAFLAAGIGYGWGAKTLTTPVAAVKAIEKTWASLAGLLFMLFLIAQFIAYFNFSELPTLASVGMATALEHAGVPTVVLLVLFVLVIAVLDIIIPGMLPKWAIFAPVFVPLFVNLGVAPQTLLGAYRVGDSPVNVITPLMVYLPFIVVQAQKYKKSAGLGTIIALMVPYTIVVLVVWIVLFVLYFLLHLPMGPGYPSHL